MISCISSHTNMHQIIKLTTHANLHRENFLADDLHVSIFAPMAVLVGITVYTFVIVSDLQMGLRPKTY